VKYLLDTDTVSFVARGVSDALTTRVLTSPPGELVISVVTRGEIEFGLRGRPNKRNTVLFMRQLLEGLPCLALSQEVAAEYGDIRATLERAGKPIGQNDLWIAAHGRCLGLTVVTHNTREFSRVARLKVEDWLG
jgi:tRNA(fMet)-specific endonuclease VapC